MMRDAMALVKHHAQLVVVFLAIVVFVPAIATAQDEVVYYHTDAIGSVRMVTDATGAVVARYDYLPFGERFETVPPATYLDRRQFAGKERDAETGFDYFGARFLRAESGRFLSVDPVAVTRGIIEPQLWNRYAYVTNNPFRYRDPDGRQREFLDHDIRDLAAGKITLDEYHARIQARGAGAAIGAGVVGIAIAGPIAWHAAYGCFLSPSCQGNTLEILEGAAGGAQRPLRSDEMGKLIGWGTGQSATAAAQTVKVTQELTKARVAQLVKQGLTREWVEKQYIQYQKKSLQPGAAEVNTQLLPRLELMKKLLELF